MNSCGYFDRFPTPHSVCVLGMLAFLSLQMSLFAAPLTPAEQALIERIEVVYLDRYQVSAEEITELVDKWREHALRDTAHLKPLILLPGFHLYESLKVTRQWNEMTALCEEILQRMRPFRQEHETEWLTWHGRIAESIMGQGNKKEGINRWYQLRDTLLTRSPVDSLFVGEVLLQICRESYHEGWIKEGLAAGLQSLRFLTAFEDSDMYAGLLINLGRIYRQQSEYVQAITHFRRAVDIMETIPELESTPADLTIPYVEIAQTYGSQGKLTLSIEFYRKAIQVMSFPQVGYTDQITILGNASGLFRGKYPEQAITYLNRALELYQIAIDDGVPIPSSTEITLNIRKGRIYHQIGEARQAKSLLIQQLQRSQKEKLTFQCLFAANVLTSIALEESEAQHALIWWQTGFECYQGQFEGKAQSWEVNPDFSVLSASLNQVAFLSYRGQALVMLSQQSAGDEKERYLNAASQTATAAQDILFQIRRMSPERSQGYNERYQDLQALKLSIELETQTENSSLRAFSLMDYSKVLSIQEDWMFEKRKREANIDRGLAERLSSLEREIIELEASIFDQKIKGRTDTLAFQMAYEKTQVLVKKRRNLHLLEDSVEVHFPSYQLSSLSLPQVTADMVRDKLIQPEEAVVSFFYSKNHLFWAVLTEDQSGSGVIAMTDSFTHLLQSVLMTIRLREGYRSTESRTASEQLYRRLFENIAPFLSDVQHMIIIPDGPLVQLPFEALVTDGRNPVRPEYLLDRFAVSYWLSARSRWILEDLNEQEEGSDKSLASFAPEYSEDPELLAMVSQDSFIADLVRSGEFQLPGALQEASVIADMWNGQVYKGAGVTEEEFMKEARNFSVLHLAMHALVERDQEDFSRLLFAPSHSESRGFLSALEISEMELPAEMVVLSACNTGNGEWRAGEGVFHLGRAFRLAGVRSLVMTLWKIPDQATSDLMPDFYQYLKEGDNKSMALRKAKLAYLEQADPAFSSPYYWAGFILMGDDRTLTVSGANSISAWMIALILLGLGSGILFSWRRQNRRNRSG